MDIPLRVIDLPVSASYISLLQKAGVEIIVESRWLNAVSIRIKSDYQLGLISMLPFVKKIEYVKNTKVWMKHCHWIITHFTDILNLQQMIMVEHIIKII